jgi:5-methylcytosine-specific restriction endonuclease McrA
MPVRIRSVNLIFGRRCIFSKILQRPTLVLNRNWQPVHVATVARALVMLWNESARVVDPSDYQTYTWEDWSKLRPAEGERFIRAVRFRLRVPEVITLTDYDRLPAATVSFSRRNIFKRDHYTCQYCGHQGWSQLGEHSRSGAPIDNRSPRYQRNRPPQQPGMEELTLDHVIPRAQGGESRWDNCVLACLECNKRKADRTPEQAKMRLRRKPVQPGWNLQYAIHQQRIESWSKFVSEAYWTVELEQ